MNMLKSKEFWIGAALGLFVGPRVLKWSQAQLATLRGGNGA